MYATVPVKAIMRRCVYVCVCVCIIYMGEK